MAELDLSKRVGPGSFKLALWQWGVVAVVAFLVIRHYFAASPTPADGAAVGGRKPRGGGARGPRGPRGPKGPKGAKGAKGGGGGGGGHKGKKAAAALAPDGAPPMDPLALVEDTGPKVPLTEQVPSGATSTSPLTPPPRDLPRGVAWHPDRQRPIRARALAGDRDPVSDPATVTPELDAPGELGGV